MTLHQLRPHQIIQHHQRNTNKNYKLVKGHKRKKKNSIYLFKQAGHRERATKARENCEAGLDFKNHRKLLAPKFKSQKKGAKLASQATFADNPQIYLNPNNHSPHLHRLLSFSHFAHHLFDEIPHRERCTW